MKNIIIALFLLIPSLLMSQINEVCITQIRCDARGLYISILYNMSGTYAVPLSCQFKLTDGNSYTATFTEVCAGYGTRDITLVSVPCNTIDFASTMYVRYYNRSLGINLTRPFVNGLCTGSGGCCFSGYFPPACEMSVASATQAKTCSTLGSVSLSLSNGTAPFTYLWSTGATTSTLTPTNVGTYAVTVTDAKNCQTVKSDIVVTGNLSTVTTSEPRTCTTRGKASATPSGGVPPYTYKWNTGSTVSSLTDLFPNTYSVTVTDALNCTTIKDIIVTDQCTTPICNMSITATTQAKTCSSAGSATILVASGRLPYTYLWSNGATTNFVANLNAGTYAVTVTDALGCRIVKSDIIVADNCPCNLSFRTDIKGYCLNQLGTIKIVVESGQPPFNILWTGGGFPGTGQTIYTSVPRIYTITVTDGNGCKVVKDVAAVDACPPDCPKYIDNCRTEWEQFVIKNYAPAKCKQWEKNCDTKSDIRRDGKVAIGLSLTAVPDGFNLAVQGGVIANDVKVKLCDRINDRWCDYVFDDAYKLMPLSDLNRYIRQNKRLPNMPSTTDIDKENGYEIKKLALLQQEKIEEAYLHLIKLEEKIKNLTNSVEATRQRNNKIAHLLKNRK